MEINRQVESDTYRVILPRQNGTEVLLARTDSRFVLPSVEVPRWQRVAESLTTAMRDKWQCEAICLFTPDGNVAGVSSKGSFYQVMEFCGSTKEQDHPLSQWVSASSLSQHSLADPSDYVATQRSLGEYEAYISGPAPGPFARPGWFRELRRWVEEVIGPLGLRLKNEFCQFNASPSFSLIRFETTSRAIWFKAVGEPNLREFPISVRLAQLFPSYVPHLLATRPAWNGWLAEEIGGFSLAEDQDTEPWKAAATALANLQIASIGKHAQLLNAGARDLRASVFSNAVEPFLEVMARLMEEQVKIPPAVLTGKELLLLGEHAQEALSSLQQVGVPDTLGHLDLNPGNIIVSPNGCRFLDWAEAYVGHPFFTFQYLLEHFRRGVGADQQLEAQLVSTYAKPWQALFPRDAVAEAFAAAPMLAVFAYAVGCEIWRDPEKLQQANAAGYLRSLTRRMKREADQLIDRRSQCLN